MREKEIRGVLKEYKKTNELWMNPNDLVDCLERLLKLEKLVTWINKTKVEKCPITKLKCYDEKLIQIERKALILTPNKEK